MLFPLQVHSPANPVRGAAYSTYGLKPSSAIIAFSVGDQASSSDSYVTRDAAGDMPTLSISGGILTFSHPQTHSYVGIGDKVTFSTETVYITGKISTRQWVVRNADGTQPDEVSNETLISIDKVFSTLLAAIGGSSSGAKSLMGTDDLASLSSALYIPCYAKSSNTSDQIDITGWTTSYADYIRVFAPDSIEKECNSSQKHGYTYGGFFIESNAATSLIKTSSDNVIIEGLSLKETGACGIGIELAGEGMVIDCILNGFGSDASIKVTETTGVARVIGNIVYGSSTVGIKANDTTALVNNTVNGHATGYQFTGSSQYVANCLAASNATNSFDTPPTLYNCASDDATAGSSNGCVSNAAIKFYDSTSGDFRLTNANDERLIRSGLDLRSVQPYMMTVDAVGTLNDDTPSMGAFHLIPVVVTAIGDITNDLSSGGNVSITDGIATFSTAQTNSLLSAGCKVEYTTGSFVLLEKISTTQWRTIGGSEGLAPSNLGSIAINSIHAQFNSVSTSSLPNPDIWYYDFKWKILCIEKTGTSHNYANFDTIGVIPDKTRTVELYAPVEGSECNSRRRHSGVWDDSLMYISRVFSELTNYITIRGLQINATGGYDGIYSIGAGIVIDGNIVKNADIGIRVEPDAPFSGSSIAVFNNIVYDCDEEAIKMEVSGNGVDNRFYIYNNTCYNSLYGISFKETVSSDNVSNRIRLINNLLVLNTVDIIGDSARSPEVTSESNWTSDSSGFILDLDNNNDILRTISFVGYRDFHIPLYQHLQMDGSYAASADHAYQIYSDVDDETRPVDDRWSIGADQYSIPSKKIAIVSAGSAVGDLQGGAGDSVSVSGSIATFQNNLDLAIGIGDKVTFAGHADVYLAERGDGNIWRVVDNQGSSVSDFTDTLSTIERVFGSASGAFTGLQAQLGYGSKDVVTNETEVKIECYQDGSSPDSSTTTVTGWIANATYPITIETPYDTNTQCGRRQRHSGVWSDSKYRIEATGDLFSIYDDYIYIDGIQMDPDGNKAVVFFTSDEARVERCLIKNASTGMYQNAGAYSVRVNANTFYDCTSAMYLIQGTCNNNTAISEAAGTIFNCSGSVTGTNNLAQSAAAVNYSTSGIWISCISQDSTAVGANCKTGVTLGFLDASADDYHLARDDFEAIGYGASDSNNPLYDIDTESIIDLSIGSDCPAFATRSQTFSCGRDTTNFAGLALTVTIKEGIATFGSQITESRIMAGDKLIYGPTGNFTAYLKRKISNSKWEVVDHIGNSPSDVSAVAVVSLSRTFNNIENVFDTSSSESIAQFYGDSTNPFTALDKARMQITIALANDQENPLPVIIDGFTADSENYFHITAPVEGSYANQRHKHNGYPPDHTTKRSTLTLAASTTETKIVYLNVAYTRIDGIIIRSNSGGPAGLDCISVNAVGCHIVNNIIRTGNNGIISAASSLSTVIANNIVFQCYNSGISTSLNDYVLNNTVVNIASGYGINDTVLSDLVNNIVQSCPGGCYNLGFASYCISDDGSATGVGSFKKTLVFENAGLFNYNLAKEDPRGRGRDLNGYSAYSFDTDAIGTERGRFWDNGALEYQPTRKLFYSVGDKTGFQTNVTSVTLKMEVYGNGIGEFTEPQTSEFLVSGDKITTSSGTDIYLAEKISTSRWTVTDYQGNETAVGRYTIVDISRAFTSFSGLYYNIYTNLWSDDLTTLETQLNITVPNDTGSSANSDTFSFTSDVDYFLRIFSPSNIDKHCNVDQSNGGFYENGGRLIVASSTAIHIQDTDYVEVVGLSIQSLASIGIHLENCTRFLLESNIVRYSIGGGILCETDLASSTGRISAVINNIINGCNLFGIKIQGDDANEVWVLNNTIYECGRGIHHVKGETGGVHLYLYNNIIQKSSFVDIAQDHTENNIPFNSLYNITRDDTAGNNFGNISEMVIDFLNPANEVFILEPETDYAAIDTALDMRTVSPFYYNTDIRGIERSNLLWDRGAIERNENIGSGTLTLGPLQMSNSIGIMLDEDARPTSTLYVRSSSTDRAPLYNQFRISDGTTFDSSPGALDLDAYLAWNTIDNIIIYVEAGASFEWVFALSSRGVSTVTITTDPFEISSSGMASIVYTTALVDDASEQENVTFENLKIYSVNAQTSDYLVGNAALTTQLTLINCIVQVNENAIVGTASCRVNLINSIVLFFNKSDAATIYLAENALVGHTNFNSILMVESADAESFVTNNGTLSDYVNNCISFNHGSGTLEISVSTGRKVSCLEDTDPELTEVESDWNLNNVSATMEQSNFTPLFSSPVVDSGNDSVVATYEISTDIIGNDRIFETGSIDIGPYELEIHILDIKGSDIRSIDQEKIEIDRINRRLTSLSNDVVYTGAYERFLSQTSMEEFVREEKISIVLKANENTVILKTDKVNKTLAVFEAYFDAPTRTILVTKKGGELSRMLSRILESDLYVLHFNEQENKLYLYLNEVATLGTNGLRNPVKNVRFGGNPTVSLNI